MYQDKFMDYPLQGFQTTHSPLNYYIPDQHAQSFFADLPLQSISNLPLQPVSNPYAPSTRSRLPTSNSNHSVSKWAFTEMSTQDHKEEQSIIPCFLQGEPNQKVEIVTEATFKPHQLQEHLKQAKQQKQMQDAGLQQRGSNRLAESKSLRRLLANTLLNGQKEEPKEKGCRQTIEKGKTKYQKILDQFFQKPTKNIQSKATLDKVINFKIKYDQFLPTKQVIKSQQFHPEKEDIREKQYNRRKMIQLHKETPDIKNFQIKKAIVHNQQKVWPQSTANKTALVKTFSQPQLNKRPETSRNHSNQSKDPFIREGWMKMSFSERQSRTLSNRREKEALGHKLSQQKQIRSCSFKPKTIQYKGRKPQQTASSYAKLYIEKIRRRI